jgi:hypothetical protein
MSLEPRRRTFITERSISTTASPDEVMRRLRDATTWPEWQPEIISTVGSRSLDPGEDVVGSAKLLGFLVDGRSRVEQVTDSSIGEDVIVGVRMRIRFDIQATDDGCVVTRHLIADMPSGPMGRVLSWFLRRRLKKMSVDLLDRLVSQSEETPAA